MLDRPVTLEELGMQRIDRLSSELDFGVSNSILKERFLKYMELWNHYSLQQTPTWSSDITDDGTPLEFSIAFNSNNPTNLRILFEPLNFSGMNSLIQRWEAGWIQTQHVAKTYPRVSLKQFDEVADLFKPIETSCAKFSLWHGIDLSDAIDHAIPKVYFNPLIFGQSLAPDLIRKALDRLGFSHAWLRLEAVITESLNQFIYFSLDLTHPSEARLKIYVAHHRATYSQVETMLAGSQGYNSGDASNWCRSILGGNGPYSDRPLISCFAFKNSEPCPKVTLHLPIRCYVANDEVSAWRISSHLPPRVAGSYLKAIRAFSGRNLRNGRSLQTYASFCPQPKGHRLTVYLAPEYYHVSPPLVAPSSETTLHYVSSIKSEESYTPQDISQSSRTMADVELMIDEYADKLGETTFCRRLCHPGKLADLSIIARGLTFFIMSFQDMLRKCADLICDPNLQELAIRHRLEDLGHEAWFIHDLRQISYEPELLWLFGPEHEITRDAAFEMMAELYRTTDDRVRIAVLLALEAAGHVFFKRASRYFQSYNSSEPLLYFSQSHLNVEEAHDVFDHERSCDLQSIELTASALKEVKDVVSRIFSAFARMADDLEFQLKLNEDKAYGPEAIPEA